MGHFSVDLSSKGNLPLGCFIASIFSFSLAGEGSQDKEHSVLVSSSVFPIELTVFYWRLHSSSTTHLSQVAKMVEH
jgi:hypothetical protein